MFFDLQICIVHILSFGLLLESLGGFLWVLGLVLDSQLTFDKSRHLSGAYPTLAEKGLVVVFAGFASLGISILEYNQCRQQR